jgi:choline dehydrogenase-like flavoprotein
VLDPLQSRLSADPLNMLIDLAEVVQTTEQPRCSTVCVAGGGIAGLVLATALAEMGVDVHLLEGGGDKSEERSQSLYNAHMAAMNHTGTHDGRFRLFGGSSTRWGGQLLAFTDEVFAPPEGLRSPAWPLAPSTLKPYYKRVEKIMGVSEFPRSNQMAHALTRAVAEDSSVELRMRFSKCAPFSHRNLARTLGREAIRSNRITVFLHANLVECLISPDGSRVECFVVRDFRGHQFRFVAQQYVLAAGTIENSRLLLASRSVCRTGVGNGFGRVGKCFHDHVEAPVATLVGKSRERFTSLLGPFVYRGTTFGARMEATIALRRRLGLPAIMACLTIEEPEDSPMYLVREILRSFQRREMGRLLLRQGARVPPACVELLRLAYSAYVKNRRAVSQKARVCLLVGCEQFSPQNHIRLSDTESDALGVPKVIVDWRVDPEEIQAIRRYSQQLRREFDRMRLPPLHWDNRALDESSEEFPDVRDTNHPMGGTIMGTDRTQSVVDENLCVHGVSNLHVAGCSTFPSGGSSNPTFTMMCLSLRLSERLNRLVRAGS